MAFEIKNGEITEEQFEEIFWGDQWREVTGETITSQSRWSTYFEAVLQHIDTEVFVKVSWSRGSTEQQDHGLEDLQLTIVQPVEKTIVVYEDVTNEG